MSEVINITESTPDHNNIGNDRDFTGEISVPLNGETLFGQTGPQTVSDLHGNLYALLRLLGIVPAVRRGAVPFEGSPVNLTGTWTTDGGDATLINGVGGAATAELRIGDMVTDTAGSRAVSVVTAINTDDQFQVARAYDAPLSGATIARLSTLAERLRDISVFKYVGNDAEYQPSGNAVIGGTVITTSDKLQIGGSEHVKGGAKVDGAITPYDPGAGTPDDAYETPVASLPDTVNDTRASFYIGNNASGEAKAKFIAGVHGGAVGEAWILCDSAGDLQYALKTAQSHEFYVSETSNVAAIDTLGVSAVGLRDLPSGVSISGYDVNGVRLPVRAVPFTGVSGFTYVTLPNYYAWLAIRLTSPGNYTSFWLDSSSISFRDLALVPALCNGTIYYYSTD